MQPIIILSRENARGERYLRVRVRRSPVLGDKRLLAHLLGTPYGLTLPEALTIATSWAKTQSVPFVWLDTQMASEELARAVELALANDWFGAHRIAQRFDENEQANWLHAVLHKIAGDDANSRYWYARSGGHAYEDFADARAELIAIRAALASRADC